MEHEIGEFELETGEPETPREPDPSGDRTRILLLAAVAVIVIALVTFWAVRRGGEPEAPPETAAPPTQPERQPAETETEVPDGPPIELPALDASDEVVRGLVAGLSQRPELAAWLANDQLVRRFVAMVDNVAEGASPRPHLTFLTPEQPFQAVDLGGGRTVIDPGSYRRYNLLAAVVGSVDSEGAVKLLKNLDPLIQDAYGELGYPGGSFEDTLDRAIRSLLAVPVLSDEPVHLESGVTAYRYAAPELEALTEAQKHLLRTGPDNTRVLQAKLREIQAALRKSNPQKQPG